MFPEKISPRRSNPTDILRQMSINNCPQRLESTVVCPEGKKEKSGEKINRELYWMHMHCCRYLFDDDCDDGLTRLS